MTLRRAIRAKELAHHRLGKNEKKAKIYIKIADLETYLNRNRIGAVA